MFFNKKNKARTIDTLIDKDISVRGNVTYSGGIRVDGSIQGNLTELPGTAGTLIMGIYPNIFLDPIHMSVNFLLEQMNV